MADEKTKLAQAAVAAYTRSAKANVETAAILANEGTAKALRLSTNPPKVSASLKKAGTLLVLAPDPLTAVPGVAMIALSFAAKSREPAGITDLIRESRKIMREIESLR